MLSAQMAAVRRTFIALRNRNFCLFWTGSVVSQAGTWVQNTALAWLMLQLTHSPLAFSTLTTIQFAPTLGFSLFGGVLADRLPKRPLLLTTQSVMMVQAFVLAALTASGLINVWEIYALTLISGTANALDNPTRQAFVIELVGPEDLPNAVALTSSQYQLARLTGPALGGIGIATIGSAGCFFVNALSFLAVIGALIAMRPRDFISVPTPARGAVLKQVGAGVRYSVRTPDIALVMLLMAVLGTFGYNFSVYFPLVARNLLHAGAVGFGVVTSTAAIGSVLASLGVAYLGRATRRTLLIGATGFSLMLGAVALSHAWALTLPLLVGLGMTSSIFTAVANSRAQMVSEPQYRGRVMSIYMLLFLGSTPVGALIFGALASVAGVSIGLAEMAAVCLAGVVAALIVMRRLRDRLLPESALVAEARRLEEAPQEASIEAGSAVH